MDCPPNQQPCRDISTSQNQEIGFIHPPASSYRSFNSAKHCQQYRNHLERPEVDAGVVNRNASLCHHFFNMPKTQGIGHITAYTSEHGLLRLVTALNNLAQPLIQPGSSGWLGDFIESSKQARLMLQKRGHVVLATSIKSQQIGVIK